MYQKIYLFAWLLFWGTICFGQTSATEQKKIVVLEIKSEIDVRVSRYIKLGLAYASEKKADYIIIDMNTYGGALYDTKETIDLLIGEKIPIWVFINTNAASAGALISIACDSIYMAPNASIGAATVVNDKGEKMPDKYQSYMRSIMRSTAETNHRDPAIAEGMVDENVVIPNVKEAGKIITFTASEALQHGYCEGKASSIEEIAQRNIKGTYTIDTFKLSQTEKFIAFFLNPFISGILLAIVLGGIYFELQTPGIGFPLFAAIVALSLYLTPYYLNGLTQWWEIILLLVGVGLLLTEIFVIPGFGIIGILGIGIMICSLAFMMLDNDYLNFEFVSLGALSEALLAVTGAIGLAAMLILWWSPKLAKSKSFSPFVHTDAQLSVEGYRVNNTPLSIIGKTGIAHTVLRPSGKVIIDNALYDAVSYGEYIEHGASVEVVDTESITLRVRKI